MATRGSAHSSEVAAVARGGAALEATVAEALAELRAGPPPPPPLPAVLAPALATARSMGEVFLRAPASPPASPRAYFATVDGDDEAPAGVEDVDAGSDLSAGEVVLGGDYAPATRVRLHPLSLARGRRRRRPAAAGPPALAGDAAVL